MTIALACAATDEGIGAPETRRAAELAVAALAGDDTLNSLRALGPFDEHGDLRDPLIRFEAY